MHGAEVRIAIGASPGGERLDAAVERARNPSAPPNESCSLISDVRPAAEIVRTLAADADAIRTSTAG
jgi:hypothetical protein